MMMAHTFNPCTRGKQRVTASLVYRGASSKTVRREAGGSGRALSSREHAWAGLIFLLSISFKILVLAGHGGGACL